MSHATWLGGPNDGRCIDIPPHIRGVNCLPAWPDHNIEGELPIVYSPVITGPTGDRWIVFDGEEYGIWTPIYNADLADDLAARRALEQIQESRLAQLDCYRQTIVHHWQDRLIESPRWVLASVGWRTRIREEDA